MGRGRSSSGGSRGGSSFGGSSRGRSTFSSGIGRGSRVGRSHSRTTVIIGGGHYHDDYHGHSTGSPVVGIVVGALFALVGLILLISGFVNFSQAFKYSKVSAECVGNEYSMGWYYSIYDYTVDGVKYDDVRSNQGWEFDEEVGKTVTIYYLKSDPSEISEERPVSIGDGITQVIFALVFGGIGVLVMVICIKQTKASKNANNSTEDVTLSPPVKEDTHNVCEYCGSKYDKSLNSCPKCGASK